MDKKLAELPKIGDDKKRWERNVTIAKEFIAEVGAGYARLLEEWTGDKIDSSMVDFYVDGVHAFFSNRLSSDSILNRFAYEDIAEFLKNRAFMYECLHMEKDAKLLAARIGQFFRQGDPKYTAFTISGSAATVLPSTNDLKISRISLERDRGYQGNGNRAIDAGEILSLRVSLKNHGKEDWRSTSAFLMSMDPLVQVDVSEVVYSVRDESTGETRTFVPGMEIDSPTSYTISISPNCPDQAELKLKLRVWDSDFGGQNDEFAEYFTLKVNRIGPLVFGDIKIDDDIPGYSNGNGNGLIEPLETIEYRMAIRNEGSVPVDEVQALMSTDSKFVGFSSSPPGAILRFKRVEPRADRPLSSSFIFSIGADSSVDDTGFFLLLKTEAKARGASYAWLDGYTEKVVRAVKVRVNSIPEGAEIEVNGAAVGKAPLETAPLPAGHDLNIVAVHSGISASMKTIVPLDGNPIEIRVDKEIQINTVPTAATLLLDGEVLGLPPVKIRLEAGSAHELSADFGEWSATERFSVDAGISELTLVPQTGSLRVSVQPSGASISADGLSFLRSGLGSYIAQDVAPGSYDIDVSLKDYDSQRERILIANGTKHELDISLQKSRRSLTIQSDPPGARINVDGSYIGTTPFITKDYEVGTKLSISADFDGTMSAFQTVEVGSASSAITIRPENGSIRLSVNPPSSKVEIDGVVMVPDSEGTCAATNIAPGGHKAIISKAGYEPSSQTLVVHAGLALNIAINLIKIEPMPTVFVHGGTFFMGSNSGESDEKPVHQVMVSSFMLGKYEVTQEQYQKVMGTNPSKFKSDSDALRKPVEQVSWYDAVAFCNKRSEMEGLNKVYKINGQDVAADFRMNGYRLPTEAEWEYAARGGNQSRGYSYSGSNNLDQIAWYESNSGSTTHVVGTKDPNELGLYDMIGNVWEWCWDRFASSYKAGSQTDPIGPSSDVGPVLRGWCWKNSAEGLRLTRRSYGSPDSCSDGLGFRVVRRP